MSAALEGRWYRCRGFADGILAFDAIEFAENDHWFALEDDGSGRLVRSRDPARYGYAFADAPAFLTIHFANGEEQSLTLLIHQEKRTMTVLRSTNSSVNSAYVHE